MPSRNELQPLAAKRLKHPAWHYNILGITAKNPKSCFVMFRLCCHELAGRKAMSIYSDLRQSANETAQVARAIGPTF